MFQLTVTEHSVTLVSVLTATGPGGVHTAIEKLKGIVTEITIAKKKVRIFFIGVGFWFFIRFLKNALDLFKHLLYFFTIMDFYCLVF